MINNFDPLNDSPFDAPLNAGDMPWLLPIRVSSDLLISLQLVACVCGKDKNSILQVSRLCVEDSIKICDGMEKPPTKKRRGPYGKRNYDSELQTISLTLQPISLTLKPISLTLESLETNVLESTYTLQDSSAIWTEVFHSFDLKIIISLFGQIH